MVHLSIDVEGNRGNMSRSRVRKMDSFEEGG